MEPMAGLWFGWRTWALGNADLESWLHVLGYRWAGLHIGGTTWWFESGGGVAMAAMMMAVVELKPWWLGEVIGGDWNVWALELNVVEEWRWLGLLWIMHMMIMMIAWAIGGGMAPWYWWIGNYVYDGIRLCSNENNGFDWRIEVVWLWSVICDGANSLLKKTWKVKHMGYNPRGGGEAAGKEVGDWLVEVCPWIVIDSEGV